MNFIEHIKAKLLNPLPGIDAQMRMAPPVRSREMYPPDNVRLGGVLILLIEGDKFWNTILIRRTDDGQIHGGQISFPGGKKDYTDTDIIATALRECEEEIGIDRNKIEVLGTMTPLYIPPSNFLVTPTIGYIQNVQAFKPSEKEVKEIIRVPLSLLFDPSVKEERTVMSSDVKNQEMKAPVYVLNEDIIIWGATAMMIAELEHIVTI